MKNPDGLTRDAIIHALVEALEPMDYVHAFWEGGAAAFNRIDEWSDIDVYLVVDDGKINETFLAVERALRSLSPVKQKYGVTQTSWPGVYQAFYKLEGANEYLIIDLAILTLSAPDKFLEPEMHGEAVFYFNKSEAIRPTSLDKSALLKKLRKRLKRLKAKFSMFNNFVQKEINRGNYLEAIELYRVLTLASLVEILRIKNNPVHHDFKTQYVHHELPLKTIEKLKSLYFVADEKDLQGKYHKATKWFNEATSEISQKDIERRLLGSSKS